VCHVGGGARAGQRLRRARGEVAVDGTRITAGGCWSLVRASPPVHKGRRLGTGCARRRRPLGGPHSILPPPGGPLAAVTRWPGGSVEGGGDSGDLGRPWPGGGRLGDLGLAQRCVELQAHPLGAHDPLGFVEHCVSERVDSHLCHPLRLARRWPELSLGVDRRFLAVVIDLDTPRLGLLGHRDRQP
jgi:hypothetical protein